MAMATSNPVRVLRALLLAGATLALLMLACGTFGGVVPFFDTMAQFRAHFSALLLIAGLCLLVLRPRLAGVLAMLAGTAGLMAVSSYYLPMEENPLVRVSDVSAPSPTPRYTLLQMNLRWDASDKAEAIRRIGELSPDVLALEEASRGWAPLLGALSHLYPYRFGCPNPGDFTDALILSKRPFVAGETGECSRDGRFARRAVDFNGRKVEIVAQHLRWPWPGSQWRQIGFTEPQLTRLKTFDRPVLVAGDFNSAPWSASLARYADLGGLDIVRGIGPSWFFRPLTAWIAPYAGLPIDNILHSGAIDILDVARERATDSDHLPLLVTFALPTTSGSEPQITVAAKR